jgi:hypothetical protein
VGGFGRSFKNTAKVKTAADLATLDWAAIQEEADQLYTEFVADFKNKGYQIISRGTFGQTDTYKGWNKQTSPESQFTRTLKKDLLGGGAMVRDKVERYSEQTMATAPLLNPIVVIHGDTYSAAKKWCEPNGIEYADGMYLAGKIFTNLEVNNFYRKSPKFILGFCFLY